MTDISQPLQNGFPWGSRTAARTNPYEDSPNTGTKLCVLACFSVDVANNAADTNAAGVFRNYDFTLKRGFIAPDGVNKSVILINGQFPGVSREMVSILQRLLTAVQPTLEANWVGKTETTIDSWRLLTLTRETCSRSLYTIRSQDLKKVPHFTGKNRPCLQSYQR